MARRHRALNRGVTLVELAFIIAAMAVVAAAFVPDLVESSRTRMAQKAAADVANIHSAAQWYFANSSPKGSPDVARWPGEGVFPAATSDGFATCAPRIGVTPQQQLVAGGYLTNDAFVSSWGSPYLTQLVTGTGFAPPTNVCGLMVSTALPTPVATTFRSLLPIATCVADSNCIGAAPGTSCCSSTIPKPGSEAPFKFLTGTWLPPNVYSTSARSVTSCVCSGCFAGTAYGSTKTCTISGTVTATSFPDGVVRPPVPMTSTCELAYANTTCSGAPFVDAPSTCPSACTVGSGEVFATPGRYSYLMPRGFSSVTIRAWGGGGAGGAQVGATGGGGAFVSSTFAIVSGQVLEIHVGEGGQARCLGPGRCTLAGNGAGASAVFLGFGVFTPGAGTKLVVAAGGGGGGSDGNSGRTHQGGRGGAGGGLIGEAGQAVLNPNSWCPDVEGGQGGTQTAGGAGGPASPGVVRPACFGTAGASMAGGGSNLLACAPHMGARWWQQGGGASNGRGGGGGAGYFGGGSSGYITTYCSGGGGGGSSYVDSTGTGTVMSGGLGQLQGNAVESGGAGRGGDDAVAGFPTASGQPGRIELIF